MEQQKDYQKDFGSAKNAKKSLHPILTFYLKKNKFINIKTNKIITEGFHTNGNIQMFQLRKKNNKQSSGKKISLSWLRL